VSAPSRPLPDVTAPLTAPFYEAAKRHVLTVQKCNQCGQLRFPPLELCPNCWSTDQTWQEIEPTGTVWSYVVYHRALDPSKKDEIPYVVGRVKTDAGPVFTVRLDVPPGQARVGMPVVATWEDVNDEVTLLRFTKP
jgi:uncharacterized OB-fold protein